MQTDIQKSGKFARLRKALQIYSSLDKEQKQILKKGQARASYTAEVWLILLRKKAEFDTYADSVRPTLGNNAAIFVIVPLFLGGFGAFWVISTELLPLIYFYFGLLTLSVLYGIYSLVMYIFLKSVDIPNYLRQFIVPLLAIIKEESRETALVQMSIDLRRKDRKDNQISEERNYKPSKFGWIANFIFLVPIALVVWGLTNNEEGWIIIGLFTFFFSIFIRIFVGVFAKKYPRIITTEHHFPWLDLETQLYDGSRLKINVTDQVLRRKITRKKRGSSGKTKIKTKTKYKILTETSVYLALPHKRYQVSDPIPLNRDADGVKMKHKSSDKREVLKIHGKHKSKNIKEAISINYLLNLVVAAYEKADLAESRH